MDPGTESMESVIKTYGYPYGGGRKKAKKKKSFLARNSVLAFLSCMHSAPPSLCSATLPADGLGCYKFTCKFHKMLYCYQLY